MKALTAIPILLATVALGACGNSDAGNPDSKLTAAQASEPLPATAAKQLASIREEANEVIGGGPEAFEERLAELRGFPVVVNKWASWCGPCRLEFPEFQSEAIERGRDVAFLGVLSNDSEEAGETFLEELPLPYPSYHDPDEKIAKLIDALPGFPATSFYNRKGELVYTKLGPYETQEALNADIERHID
jgi:cytochrome c biogenesis protein CcmG/thiol:disulfide interchange protein DsbE